MRIFIKISLCLFIILQSIAVNSDETEKEDYFDPTVFVCSEEKKLCWPKCCNNQEIFDLEIESCAERPNNSIIELSIYELSLNETKLSLLTDRTATAIPDYGLFMHHELCNDSMNYFDFDQKVLFLSDGRMYVDNNQVVEIYESGFCIDLFVHKKNGISTLSAYVCSGISPAVTFKLPNNIKPKGNVCSREFDLVSFYRTLRIAYTISGVFSLLFLGLTIYLYMTLPSLNNFHCKLMSVNLLFIFLTTFLLILMYNVQPDSQYNPNNSEFFVYIPQSLCAFFGYLLYFTGVSKFFLMTVLCVDLYWMFSNLKKPEPIETCGPRSLFYLVVGLVVPLVMTVSTVLVDFFKPFEYLPDVGSESCFLALKSAQVKRFYNCINIK